MSIERITGEVQKKYNLRWSDIGLWVFVKNDKPLAVGGKNELPAIVLAQYLIRKRQQKAARKALSIVNQLSPGKFRAKHATRVFSNMNKLRAAA